MIVVPAVVALNAPVVGLIDATPVLLEVQVPPEVVLLNVVEVPAHAALAPPIAARAGKLFTVKLVLAELVHPFPSVTVYVIVEVPALTPVTAPEESFTVAVDVLDELQVPPVAEELDKVELAPTQAEAVPVIDPALGSAFSVTTAAAEVAAQPLLFVTVTV
jgi:hypothetical protein